MPDTLTKVRDRGRTSRGQSAAGSATDAPHGTNTDPLMTIDDLAAYLAMKRSWLYNHRDELPTLKLGAHLRWRRADIDRWLSEQQERRAS